MFECDVQLGVSALGTTDLGTILSQVVGYPCLLSLPSRAIVEYQLRRTGRALGSRGQSTDPFIVAAQSLNLKSASSLGDS